MQAVILVGGEGTRLRPLTSTVPKPVVPLVDRPFIAYMLEWLARHGVDDVDHVVRLPGHRRAQRARRRLAVRAAAALHRGARAARDRRRAEVRRGPPRRALPDAQRRRPDRHRPDRADRPARGRRAPSATLALVPRRRPDAPTASCACNDDHSVKEFVEKPSADQIDTNADLGRRLRARARRCSTSSRPTATSRSSARCGRSSSARASTASPPRPTGWTSAPPSATCRAPSTSSRATSRRPWPSASGSGYLAVGDRVQADGRIVPPALVERGCEIAAGAHVGSLVVLGEGVTRGGGHDDRALGGPRTAPRSARGACCATASSPPGCASARARRSPAAPCSARA